MIQRRTPLKRVSSKRRKDMKTYSLLRSAFLHLHPFCQIWLKKQDVLEDWLLGEWKGFGEPERFYLAGKEVPRATDVHHREGRGINYLNVDTWTAACRREHEWVKEHPSEARRLGFLK